MIFLAVLPILTVGLFAIVFKVFPIFDKVFKKYDNLNNVVQENLYGMRVVKSYVREDFEKEKFEKEIIKQEVIDLSITSCFFTSLFTHV